MSPEEDRRWFSTTTTRLHCLTGCLLPLVLVGGLAAQGPPSVWWQGRPSSLQELAESMPAVVETIAGWAGYAEGTDSRFVVSDDGRVVLVVSGSYRPAGRKREHREVAVLRKLVEQTIEVVDRALPPAGAAAGDPTAVVVCVRLEHYPRLLDNMAERDGRLAGWARTAGRMAAGFCISRPLVAAWVENPKNTDEWNPYNELVHRTAQVLIRQRAPRLPDWLLLGLSWHVEETVLGSIYCFPHRTGFVSALSHTDWGRWLANEFKKSRRRMRDLPPVLGVEEFAAWNPRRDGFDERAAHIAFGMARFLVREHGDDVLDLVTGLSAAVEEGEKVWVSETEWTTDPDYSLPAGEQLAALQALDPDLLAAATRFFQKNRASKRIPPKKRRR